MSSNIIHLTNPSLDHSDSSNIKSRLYVLARTISQTATCLNILASTLKQENKSYKWCNTAAECFYYTTYKILQFASLDYYSDGSGEQGAIHQLSNTIYNRYYDIYTKNHQQNPALNYCIDRIQDRDIKQYEHFVASWAITMVTEIFNDVKKKQGQPGWIFTSEQTDPDSKKRPDFVVEKMKFDEGEGEYITIPWICMEYKRFGGEPTYKALHQLIKTMNKKLFEQSFEGVLTIYLVIVAGLDISFWEIDFEAIGGRQPEYDVEHIWGCRSLTQSAPKEAIEENKEPPYTTKKDNIPQSVKKLVTRKVPETADNVLKEAEEYETQAIWNIAQMDHKKPIFDIFNYMAEYPPRGF